MVLVVLAVVCDAAGLHGRVAVALFPAVVLAGSLDTGAGFVALTAFAARAVLTGFVTGHDGVLGFGDGRRQELVLFEAAAALTWLADRGGTRTRGDDGGGDGADRTRRDHARRVR